MAVDIVPELLDAILEDFAREVSKSRKLKDALTLLEAGKATYETANIHAIELGEILARVFKRNITADKLPDGRMYYNIAKRILNPTMSQNHDLIATFTAEMQTALNKADGVTIKGKAPKINQDRIDGIVEKISDDDFDKTAWLLDEPVINFSQSIVDETAKLNAEFQTNLGRQATIRRTVVGGCCDWCQALAGEYVYPDVPDDVYKRHRYCRCTVEYISEEGKRTTVHTKK